MTKNILTQARLKELLHYDPETGVFTWLINRGSTKKGRIAGSIYRNNNGKRYRRIMVCGKRYPAHWLAWLYMTGLFPVNQIDHENGNGLYNCYGNLRKATSLENHQNVKRQKNNTSGLSGVYWDRVAKKWISRIDVNKKRVRLGRFIEYFEACCARKSAEYKYNFHKNHGALRDL